MPNPRSIAWAPVDPKVGKTFISNLLKRFDDEYETFRVPVWETYPDLEKEYKEIISRPLSFIEMEDTIENRCYEHYGGFLYDILTIVWNCMEFNGSGNIFYKQATSLRQELFREFNKFASSNIPNVPHYQSITAMENDIRNYVEEIEKKGDNGEVKIKKQPVNTRSTSKGIQIKKKFLIALQKALDEMSPEQRDAVAAWLIEQTGIKGDPIEGALRGSKVEIQLNEHAGELVVKLLDHLKIKEETTPP